MWLVSEEIKMVHEEVVLTEDVGVGEMIDVVEIVGEVMVMVEIVVDREDYHMTTIVGIFLLNVTAIVEVEEIGTMTIIEDVGIDLPWEEVEEEMVIEVALPVVVVVVVTVIGAEAGQGRLGDTAPGVLLGMLEEEEVAMTTAVIGDGTMVIGVVPGTMAIGELPGTMVIGVVLGTIIIGIEALMATAVMNGMDIEEDEMIADIALEQYRVDRGTGNKLTSDNLRNLVRNLALAFYVAIDAFRISSILLHVPAVF
jgi:hypothetical protein